MPGGGGNRPGGTRSQVTGAFYGKIIEAKTSKPIEYASVQLLQNRFDSASKKRKEVSFLFFELKLLEKKKTHSNCMMSR